MSCTPAGLSLAGMPLLEKTHAGFAPRPAPEIASLIQGAYGADGDPTRLESSLGVIARALNGGDVARAGIAAVLTRTPELSQEAAARLAKADGALAKYDPDEPRDWHGRWTTGGAAGPAGGAAPADEGAGGPGAGPTDPRAANAANGAADRNASPAPAASAASDDPADHEYSRQPTSLEQAFESEYDWLGPVDFAKQVIQFGDRLGREGGSLSPADKERALAEYAFLQDRLSFWLAYEFTPPTAQGNLLSAALTLFQGANAAGIADPGHLPKSMLDVAEGAWAVDNLPPRVRFSAEPKVEIAPEAAVEAPAERAGNGPAETAPQASVEAPKEVEGLGGIVDNSRVGIRWNEGIVEQGDPAERFMEKEIPEFRRLPPTSKTFDGFIDTTGEAISVKAMNTLSVSYIKNPQRIYWRMKDYIDAAADYQPRPDIDVKPATIEAKTIQLTIPEYTSPTQWRYLFATIFYGEDRGVRVVITRIRE